MPDLPFFAVLVVLIVLFTAPITAAFVVSRFSKARMPRRGVFIVLSSLLSYGLLTFASSVVAALYWTATAAGPILDMAGHPTMFAIARSIRDYGDFLAIALLPITAILVPVKASKRWAALVSAWDLADR